MFIKIGLILTYKHTHLRLKDIRVHNRTLDVSQIFVVFECVRAGISKESWNTVSISSPFGVNQPFRKDSQSEDSRSAWTYRCQEMHLRLEVWIGFISRRWVGRGPCPSIPKDSHFTPDGIRRGRNRAWKRGAQESVDICCWYEGRNCTVDLLLNCFLAMLIHLSFDPSNSILQYSTTKRYNGLFKSS